ncbi:MAG: polyphenol oxidase family protein [Leptospiraceae bacterium]|nr:polyphenol oxidase family protein [Leptospiraceae bacterium]
MRKELFAGIQITILGKQEQHDLWDENNVHFVRSLKAGAQRNQAMRQLETEWIVNQGLAPRPELVNMLDQIHTDQMVWIPGSTGMRQAAVLPQADALASRLAGPLLVIRTADCLPLFFAFYGRGGLPDGIPAVQAIGIVHAGWRGLQMGIIEQSLHRVLATVAESAQTDGLTLEWAIGPCISGSKYEVGSEVAMHFQHVQPAERANHFYLDLNQGARTQVLDFCRQTGITEKSTNSLESCTMIENDRWYSHRAGDIFRNLNMIQIIPDFC